MIITGLLIMVVFAILNSIPLTYVAMLFAGNIGLNYGFLALLPGAMAVKFALATIITPTTPIIPTPTTTTTK
jgi:hypothetical protein